MPIDSDLELLDAAKRMDRDALVKIFDLHASPLYKYALRLCGDPALADHVVGDVFARLLEQLAAGNGPTSNLRSYLYETAYHLVIDQARSSKRRAPLEALSWLPADRRSSAPGTEDPILLEAIWHAIQNDLSENQRHVIILRFLEEFSLRETAKIMGIEIGHVKVIQTRAIARLRQALTSREIRTLSQPRYHPLWESQRTDSRL